MKLVITCVCFCLIGITTFSQEKTSPPDPKSKKSSMAEYSYKIIPGSNNTWGYDIFVNTKLSIHQSSIPALSGNNGFKTKEDADKVAELVISKMKRGEMPPSVSLAELKELKIIQ